MEEDRESGRVNLGLSVVVRVTLKDGVYHEVKLLCSAMLNYAGRRLWVN